MSDSDKAVVVLIKDDEDRYLLVNLANYFSNYEQHKNDWGPITGHIKSNESIKHALIRETEEELGVIIEPIIQVTESNLDIPGVKIAFWWEARIKNGEIRPNKEEIARYGWFSSNDVKDLTLWPATRKFFEKFIWKK